MNENFKMDKDRKIALAVLGVFSIVIIIFGFASFSSSINDPFSYKNITPQDSLNSQKNSNSNNSCLNGDCSNEKLDSSNLDLKLIDTDGDGLSDWDERFIYQTSQYLEDTDGDGLTDFEEVITYKTNPNCPEGQECSGSFVQQSNQNNLNNNQVDDFYNYLNSTSSPLNTNTTSNQVPSELQGDNIDIDLLRKTLIENGVDKKDIDNVSDEDLLRVYQEALSSSGL